MKIDKFNQSRFYLRRDPDAGWTLAVWKWRVFFQVVVNRTPPICADTGAAKWPGNCWNVRCQLGGTCCRPASSSEGKGVGNG